MPPRQSFQPPSQPQRPQRSFTPQAPHYNYNAIPGTHPHSPHFQQHPSGHYEVVPPPQTGPNDGHSGHNPYDFIVNPNAQTRPGLNFALLNGSLLTRVALLGGALVVIMIVAAVLISSFSPKGPTTGMISIAERQQEMIRVSSNALQNQQIVSADAMNFVANVEASVTSSQMQVTGYLSAHGKKLNNKALSLDQSSATDAQLANAATANNFDSAITQNMIDQLQTYESLLQTTFNQTSSIEAKAVLQSSYNSANLLLKQAKALQQELNGGQGSS